MSENQQSGENDVATPTRDRATGVYRPSTAGPEESISVAVVEAIAEAKGVSPLELEETLYETVDLEAVEALFSSTEQVDRRRLIFTVDGHEVTVTADHDVFVQKLE